MSDFVDVLVQKTRKKKRKTEKKNHEEEEEEDDDDDTDDTDTDSRVDKNDEDDQGQGGLDVVVKEEAATDEEPEETCCTVCGSTPCEWTQYKAEVIEFAKNNQFFINHNQEEPFDPFSYPTQNFATMTEEEKEEVKNFHQEYKKKCFRFFVSCKYGKLGKGNRNRLAICVENAIRRMFPNHDNSSVGYHSSW